MLRVRSNPFKKVESRMLEIDRQVKLPRLAASTIKSGLGGDGASGWLHRPHARDTAKDQTRVASRYQVVQTSQ